ncbi:STAS domain-containing protein [Streptomyces sp. NPDC048111]|uniref:STAS domain-containing protein n=1 Tax=Streptomyces sp. NPDC048111 TaxID=3365500 RepID=UPI003711EFFB
MLRITSRAGGGRVDVTVGGELDFDTAPQLYDALTAALCQAAGGVDLDLDAVSFCDCSGLNVLLRARYDALDQGKTLVLRSADPGVARLLGLARALPLFAPPEAAWE